MSFRMIPKVNRRYVPVLVVLLLCAFAVSSHAQSMDLVGSIQVRGNKRVADSTILYYIKTKKGKPISRSRIRKDIEQIYNLGQFRDVRVETHPGVDGLDVIFIVEEIPSVGGIILHGNNEVSEDDIREKLTIKRGTTFQDHMLQEVKEQVTLLYHDKGFFLVEVDINAKLSSENLTNVNIRIREGQKVEIKNIRFVGNKRLPAGKLRDQMETQAATWISVLDESGIYKKDILKLDVLRLEGYYQNHGFIRARVLEPQVKINKRNKTIHIIISVEEGPRYKVGAIEVQPDDTLTEAEIRNAMKTKRSGIYNVSQVREDVLSITDLYSQQGHAYADVSPKTKINDASRTVDLSIEIDKGRKVYVGQISMTGNTRTLDNVIRREFRFKEGELFDSEKLKRSKQRINNLQFFEDVKINTRRGKESDLIDIVTTVTERPTGSITVGAGFSSVDSFIFNAGISQNNFLGRGQRVAFSANLSARRSDFSLSLTEPHLFDSDLLVGIDLFNRETNFYSFQKDSAGGGVRFGKSLSEYDWAGINYRLENVTVSEVDAGQETAFLKNETRLTSRISPSFVRDTRDDFLNPSTGWRHVVRFDLAGGILGGSDFIRASYEGTYYRPLIGKLIGALHGEIHWADAYAGGTLPGFERYFMGGPTSLRGYTVKNIGPKDASGDPLGGNQSLLFNAEVQYPFTRGLRGVLFYDRGNVFGAGSDTTTTDTTWSLSKMRDSIGVGARFISPFGPVGFAYGIKLDQAAGEESGEFHFTAGSAF